MKEYLFENNGLKTWIIKDNNNDYFLKGNRIDSIFKSIGHKAPNKYGNFYGHEKAGKIACEKIIKKYNLIEKEVKKND